MHFDLSIVASKIRPPVAIVLGSPAEVAQIVADSAVLGVADMTCYQMDLYQAERLEEELRRCGLSGKVVMAPDLWDLPAEFQTVLYPATQGGERQLKIDMVEQAWHVLQPRGTLVIPSPYETDQFFPSLLKKVFGRFHAPVSAGGHVFWSQRQGDRPRRRHRVTFQVRSDSGPPFRFISRPGVFSYGRFDDGARALTETMMIETGDRILDIGCGCGTNGIIAARRSGPAGSVTFVDSNLRAVAVAEHNARLNGLPNFRAVASSRVECGPGDAFDVVLANPPYYAQQAIARLFIERGQALLRPGGRFYLVTKQPNQAGPLVDAAFGATEAVSRRGYAVLCARA